MNGLLQLILLRLEKYNLKSSENSERKDMTAKKFEEDGGVFRHVMSQSEFERGLQSSKLFTLCKYRMFKVKLSDHGYVVQLVGQNNTAIDMLVSPYDLAGVVAATNNEQEDMTYSLLNPFNESQFKESHE